VTSGDTVFDECIAAHYEAWYETPEERRADGLEKAILGWMGELKWLLRSVTSGKVHIAWRTTLFPRGWPWLRTGLPWGGFIGMALIVRDGPSITTHRRFKA
jgi:hypothetical protein